MKERIKMEIIEVQLFRIGDMLSDVLVEIEDFEEKISHRENVNTELVKKITLLKKLIKELLNEP